MKRAASVIGAAFALLCLVFFLRALGDHWSAIDSISWNGKLGAGVACAFVLYGTTLLAGARSWQLVLQILAERMSYRQATGILTLSQLAKYLPGNIGHHLGRVLLARRIGVGTDIAVTSIGLETVLALAAAALCSTGALHLLPGINTRYGSQLAANAAMAAALIACVMLVAFAFPTLRRHLRALLRRCSALVSRGNRARSAMACVLYLTSFALGALALGCIALALGADGFPLASVIGVYAIAWLLGFLVPGAPAGLGVREAVLVLGLSPLFGGDVSIVTTALFRAVTVMGDGMAFALGWATADARLRGSGVPPIRATAVSPDHTRGGDDERP